MAARSTSDPRAFVCAFRGRRDSYQVPLALAEAGRLDQLITDAYARPWVKAIAAAAPERLRTSLLGREEAGVPASRVKCLWATTMLEHARHRLGFSPMRTFDLLDRRYSRAAARRAARSRSDLLLYSPYAWEAFTAPYRHDPRRVLFQYHPHPDTERALVEVDGAPVAEDLALRERDCWKHADLIVCASTFTRQSLLAAGAPADKCRVVPYGVDPASVETAGAPDAFRALFVGSGSRRKGLHHLLAAWRQARLPGASALTLVCREIESGLAEIARAMPGVEIVPWASPAQLARLYAASALFVMPSLVEGFGQVYLEALSFGCPVLGTRNTCLPDLGTEADAIFMVEPGDVAQLAHRLEALSAVLPGQAGLRGAARACALRFTWPAFRSNLRKALE